MVEAKRKLFLYRAVGNARGDRGFVSSKNFRVDMCYAKALPKYVVTPSFLNTLHPAINVTHACGCTRRIDDNLFFR